MLNFSFFFTAPNSLLNFKNENELFFFIAKSRLKSPVFSMVIVFERFSFTNRLPNDISCLAFDCKGVGEPKYTEWDSTYPIPLTFMHTARDLRLTAHDRL
jgi:hypothetical protein